MHVDVYIGAYLVYTHNQMQMGAPAKLHIIRIVIILILNRRCYLRERSVIYDVNTLRIILYYTTYMLVVWGLFDELA